MASPHAALEFLRQAAVRGERCAVIALTAVDGGTARGLGTLMAVTEAGASLGSLSGGCVEAALVAEAQRIIAKGTAEMLRLGAGSPLIDIRLPCGSGMDLLVIPQPDAAEIATACHLLEARKPIALQLHGDGRLITAEADSHTRTGWQDQGFILRINPRLRLIIAGHGEEVSSLAALGRTWGADVLVLTPDERSAAAAGGQSVILKSPSAHPALALDRYSALIMLFHDHDWETALLVQALTQAALFIGAMGSQKTHARRLAALAEAGVSSSDAARIAGPIGLIPAARDPQTLALSVLAQVVAAYNAA
ncbi:MAG: hypothetical protein RLZZ136_977 [Pseudomonadota bacterium]